MGAVVAVAVSGLIVGLQLKGDKELATEIGRWDQLAALVSSGDGTSVAEGADALPNPLRDIALLNAASMHAGSSDFEAALADLSRIGPDSDSCPSSSCPLARTDPPVASWTRHAHSSRPAVTRPRPWRSG